MTVKHIDLETTDLTLEELLAALEPNTEVMLMRGDAPVARVEALAPQKPQGKRIIGMHEGTVWMSDDFDDELPLEFWLGDDA